MTPETGEPAGTADSTDTVDVLVSGGGVAGLAAAAAFLPAALEALAGAGVKLYLDDTARGLAGVEGERVAAEQLVGGVVHLLGDPVGDGVLGLATFARGRPRRCGGRQCGDDEFSHPVELVGSEAT